MPGRLAAGGRAMPSGIHNAAGNRYDPKQNNNGGGGFAQGFNQDFSKGKDSPNSKSPHYRDN